MSDTTKTTNLPIMRRAALISASSINEADRTIDIEWTTGARRITWMWEEGSWGGLVEEELALEGADLSRLNNGAPFLKDHAAWSIDNQLGVHVDGSAVIDAAAGVGRAKIRFSKNPKVEPIWQDVKDQILRQTSVGYNVNKYVVTREEGKLPLYRAIEWTPLENSLVTIGADPGAQLRSETKPTMHPCTIITRGPTASAVVKTKETQVIPNQSKATNQVKARAMSADQMTQLKEILATHMMPADQIDACAADIDGMGLDAATSTASGTQSEDLADAARALGIEGEVTPAAINAAAKNLRALYDLKDAELDAKTKEDDEFEANEKKGLHRKLDAGSKGLARSLFNSNRALYRKEVEKVAPLDTKAPAAAKTRNTIASVADQADDLEARVLARRTEMMKADPKLTEPEAYTLAFREIQKTMPKQ